MMNIYQSINAIMADAPAIGKQQKNQQQGFMYRGVDVVMNVFQPLLTKHKVFPVPHVLECTRENRQTKTGGNLIYTVLLVKYTFYAEDGSFVECVVQGEGMDSADKSSNKAMSVAFKYAMFQLFCIPTEEMIDPDAETPPENKPYAPAPAPTQAPMRKGWVMPPDGEPEIHCENCGERIRDYYDGKTLTKAAAMAQRSMDAFKHIYCCKCAKSVNTAQ